MKYTYILVLYSQYIKYKIYYSFRKCLINIERKNWILESFLNFHYIYFVFNVRQNIDTEMYKTVKCFSKLIIMFILSLN